MIMDGVKKRKGFTLIELLIAIVIIGILMSLLIPSVSKMMEDTRRTKDADCLKQIATAYRQYCSEDVNGRNINVTESSDGGLTGLGWVLVLAKGGFLNDPNVYTFSSDSGAIKVTKKTIVDESLQNNDAWNTGGAMNLKFSVYLINNVPTDAPLSTTPIAFTRGFPSGNPAKWPATGDEVGVYGDKGGYIAFLDEHVDWFDDLGESTEGKGKLMKWGSGGTTNLIEEALPSSATILSADGINNKPGTGN
jgi:prepilin-type N-terminal cleavage/methylation domain-containing protein